MALEQCRVDGQAGWRWGNGKCHTGNSGRARAEAEGATEIVEKVEKEVKAKVSAPQTKAVETVEAKPKAPAKKKAAAKKK